MVPIAAFENTKIKNSQDQDKPLSYFLQAVFSAAVSLNI